MLTDESVLTLLETYRTALILGYGRSGRAAERLLQAEGVETSIWSEERPPDKGALRGLSTELFDVCIVSPGFPLTHPRVRQVADAGIPLRSELELGWSRHRGRTIAVTGSNGKSTAVKWICEALQLDGYKAAIGGNYGIPACDVVLDYPNLEWLVLEVSSFQLETVHHFQADAAILLNVLPNHLDRHETMDVYRHTKARIFGPQQADRKACIVPAGLAGQLQQDAGTAGNWYTFGREEAAEFRYVNGRVMQGGQAVLNLDGTPFESVMLGGCTGAAVAALSVACGLPAVRFEQAARRFEPLPHRLQKVGEMNGVTYVDDSKATNLAALAAGVEASGRDIHLIAGGLPKESDYTFVKEILAERVRRIYLVGQASQTMHQAWNGVCPCVECGTLEQAFLSAKDAARKGETVLLSPGCASFDQFRGFEERGERFSALFRNAVQAGGDAA